MKVADVFKHKPFVLPTPSEFWPIPDCRVGLEFEFENPGGIGLARILDRHPLLRYYDTHPDGSLRDNGFEFVLKDPLMGEQLKDAITLMCEANLPFMQTYRTSIHVHVDATSMELEQLKSSFLAYAMVERGLFSFVGKGRVESNYCVPWFSSPRYLAGVAGALFSADPKFSKFGNFIKNSPRYAALNINSLHKYGSLEFRHMGQTLNPKMICTWVSACMLIKKVGMTVPYDEVETWIYRTPMEVYSSVFGDLATTFLVDVTQDQHDECWHSASILASYMAAEEATVQFDKNMERGRNAAFEEAFKHLKDRP